MEKVNNNRYSYIRAFACVGIVFLHMIYGAVTIYGDGASELSRNISWIVVNNLYWAVPCFVMVTGALLLDPSRELTYKKLFSKYIFRVFFALLIFTVLYRVYDIVMNGEEFTAAGFFKGFVNFFTGSSWSHLWYLYMLIGLYLLLPFFKKITEHVTTKELGYFLLLIVVFLSLVPILKIWNIGIGFGIPVASIYPFYLFFGYTITRPEVKVSKGVAVAGLIVSTAALVALTLLRWNNPERMMSLEMFFNYSSIIVILQATSIFYLFAKKTEKVEEVVTEAEPVVAEEEPVEVATEEAVEETPAEETTEEAALQETQLVEEQPAEEKPIEETPIEETAEEEKSEEPQPEEPQPEEPQPEEPQPEKKKKENIFKKLVLSFDSCTFGVYLVHMFLARYVLRYMGLNPYDNMPLFVGLIIAVIIVSYLVVWGLRKIPKVDKVL